MAKRDEKKYGNVYEIHLPNEKYAYVCWFEEYDFGIFDYYSDKPTDLQSLISAGFKAYISCKETAVKKEIWKPIGHLDLEKENITFPDLAVFLSYDKKYFIDRSIVMHHGNSLKVSKEYYLSLLKKGYISGFFDNYKSFELWLTKYIEDYPNNQGIFPLPEE